MLAVVYSNLLFQCNIEKLVPAMQDALKKPNPQVKILLDFFVFRTLNDYDTPPMGFLKAVLPIVAKVRPTSL